MLDTLGYIYDFLTSPSTLREGYDYLPFHGALLPFLLLEIAYVTFVFRIGPWFMKNREPYKLTAVLWYYNVIQILFNSFMATLAVYLFFYKKVVPIGCMTVLPWEHPLKSLEVLAGYSYVFNKFLDLFDTIIFVLRKSYKQVTFLHVYHHIMMTSISIIYAKNIGSGGHAAITGTMNAIVHIIMYGYYFVSATRPHMKNSLWWKKYITQIQIVQFVLALIHNLWPLIIDTDCSVPKIFCVFSVIQAIMMIYLFGSFYKKSYLDQSGKSKGASKSSDKGL
ncbi:elongation of very long chain fatty acids protein F-like [Anastrepha obliqua]|uniref:elongation of very long chain fatty acids protein F-like n=1 Tax=Anastrepha obliqua TaxID=95512 RepID=UPI0024095CED|nr:elongation of very long chain fatty acids protein F-like [Anastrepha obliqua]